MTNISIGQMRLLHVLAKQSGISHDELSASAGKMFGVGSLNDLDWEQAGEMIDGLQPAGAKPMPEEPKAIRPIYARFPRLDEMRKKRSAATATPPRPPEIARPAPRPPTKPAMAPAGDRSSGGFGRMRAAMPAATTATPAAAQKLAPEQPKPKQVWGTIAPDDIPF